MYFLFSEKLTHSMDSCLTASFLGGTHLKQTSSILYVKTEEIQNRLNNYSSRFFTNSNRSHTRVFVQWNQMAGNKGTEIIGMDVSGANSAHHGKGMAQVMGGRLKIRSPPSICVKAGEASSTLCVQGCLEYAFSIKIIEYDWIYTLYAVRQHI